MAAFLLVSCRKTPSHRLSHCIPNPRILHIPAIGHKMQKAVQTHHCHWKYYTGDTCYRWRVRAVTGLKTPAGLMGSISSWATGWLPPCFGHNRIEHQPIHRVSSSLDDNLILKVLHKQPPNEPVRCSSLAIEVGNI